MSRAGWSGAKLSAPKLCHSSSTSGPSATVNPSPTNTSSSRSHAWVTSCLWPCRRSRPRNSVRSRRSTSSVAWRAIAPSSSLRTAAAASTDSRAALSAWPTSRRSLGSSSPIRALNRASGDRLPSTSNSASRSASRSSAPLTRASASLAVFEISSIMVVLRVASSGRLGRIGSVEELLEVDQREREAEDAPGPELRDRREPPAVRLDQAAADPEPEAGARRLAHVPPEELLEHLRQICDRDPLAGVGHRDRDRVLRHLAVDAHPGRARVLRGVLHEVGQHLLELVGVGVDPREAFGEGHRALEVFVGEGQ